MKKIENIQIHELLIAYMKQHYADKSALVIFQDDTESFAELGALLEELDEVGLRPPKDFSPFGMLIIEMSAAIAKNLINNHSKGAFRMWLVENGVCIHENR